MPLGLEVVGRSEVGRVRVSNEDSYGFDLRHGVFVVCDGMGGHAAGEIASSIAVETLLSYFRDKEPLAADAALIDAPLGAQLLSDAVNKANECILEYAEGHASASGMGTTLVAARFSDGRFTIAHIGDSRIYLLRQGSLVQLTEDHSLVMEQVRRGIMTVEEAKKSTAQHIITRALGTEDNSPPDLAEFPAEPGDILMLTTDGVLRHLEDPEIHDILANSVTLQAACDRLIDTAIEAGGEDNATCVLVRVKREESSPGLASVN
ncbi:MAG TPA: Stp1/IreP family PP2C-type Ser/Thr phosphatase [Candidatus Eisenbacteria bacterium]|nr:Stp1/IreP family PP2C-type Ser/Thr phosphatase [Candidatus Eisenbacteria bacterium]